MEVKGNWKTRIKEIEHLDAMEKGWQVNFKVASFEKFLVTLQYNSKQTARLGKIASIN